MTKDERQKLNQASKHLNDIIASAKSLSDVLFSLSSTDNPLSSETDVVDVQVSTPEPEGPTINEVRAKVGEAIMKMSPEVVQGVFAQYQVAKVSQFKPHQYGNIIETLDEMIKGAEK